MIQPYLSCCIFRDVIIPPGFGQCPEFKESALSWKKENPKLEMPLKQKNLEWVILPITIIDNQCKKTQGPKRKGIATKQMVENKDNPAIFFGAEKVTIIHNLFPTEVLAGLLSLIFFRGTRGEYHIFEQTVDRLYIQKFS